MSRTHELRMRREALLERSHHLRAGLVDEGRALAAQLHTVESGIGWVRSATQRPVLMAAAVAALVVFKPARALRWITRGALAVSLAKRALGLLEKRPE